LTCAPLRSILSLLQFICNKDDTGMDHR
jgi:hypothetical protein